MAQQQLTIENHWLRNANKIPSENYNLRPAGAEISLIVLHCISLPPGEFGGNAIDQLFQNCLAPEEHPYFATIAQIKVSAHVLIRRTGQFNQYVAFNLRAWHAGESMYKGCPNCNDFSIGIELEGTDDSEFTDVQYARLGDLIRCLLNHYPTLSGKRIVGHSDIAPGRKTDPGSGFDWQRLYGLIGHE